MMNDRVFVVFGIMMVVPILFMLLPIDPTYATIGTLATNLAMLFFIRNIFKKNLSGLFGHKTCFECLSCHFNKFDSRGFCKRCGSKMRKVS